MRIYNVQKVTISAWILKLCLCTYLKKGKVISTYKIISHVLSHRMPSLLCKKRDATLFCQDYPTLTLDLPISAAYRSLRTQPSISSSKPPTRVARRKTPIFAYKPDFRIFQRVVTSAEKMIILQTNWLTCTIQRVQRGGNLRLFTREFSIQRPLT